MINTLKKVRVKILTFLYEKYAKKQRDQFYRERNWQLMLDVIKAQRSWIPKSWDVLFPTKIPTTELQEMLDAAKSMGRDFVDLYDEDRRLWVKDKPESADVINGMYKKSV